jgi:hypothetical protein
MPNRCEKLAQQQQSCLTKTLGTLLKNKQKRRIKLQLIMGCMSKDYLPACLGELLLRDHELATKVFVGCKFHYEIDYYKSFPCVYKKEETNESLEDIFHIRVIPMEFICVNHKQDNDGSVVIGNPAWIDKSIDEMKCNFYGITKTKRLLRKEFQSRVIKDIKDSLNNSLDNILPLCLIHVVFVYVNTLGVRISVFSK